MAKNRYVNTHFWNDAYISELDPIEKLMFIYFLTNSFSNIAGVYEISLKQIALDTGIDKEMIIKIIDRFSRDKKIFYFNSYIFIVNFASHQDQGSEKIKSGIKRVFDELPGSIKKCIFEAVKGIDTLPYLIRIIIDNYNYNYNLNLTKKETVPEKSPAFNLQNNCKLFYEEHFIKLKGVNYYYDGKSAGSLKKLIDKIKNIMTIEKTDDNILNAFKFFIQSINDEWILENYDLPNINSKFNVILTKIKNGKQTANKYEQADNISDRNKRIFS